MKGIKMVAPENYNDSEDEEEKDSRLESSADFMRSHGWEGDVGGTGESSETKGGSEEDPGGPTGTSS